MTDLHHRQASASAQGLEFERSCMTRLKIREFRIVAQHWTDPVSGMEVDIVAKDADGPLWVECAGSWESNRNGLERTDTIYKKLGVAAVVHIMHPGRPRYWLLTSHLPVSGRAHVAVRTASAYFDRIEEVK